MPKPATKPRRPAKAKPAMKGTRGRRPRRLIEQVTGKPNIPLTVGTLVLWKKHTPPLRGQIHSKTLSGNELTGIAPFFVRFFDGTQGHFLADELEALPPLPPKLDPHPLSELLPRMTAEEFTALKSDIAVAGQLDDIITVDGQVLDGRHRQDACYELGILPRYKPFAGAQTPLQYVYSRAVHRNLTDSQKACSAVKIKREIARDAAKRAKETGKAAGSGSGDARDQAGALFGISGRYISAAESVLELDPKAFQECFEGRLPISRAVTAVRRAQKRDTLNKMAKAAAARPLDGRWEIRQGDVLKSLEDVRDGAYKLAFADPPYNLGLDYGEGTDADRLPEPEYLEWCERWMRGLHRALADDGALWVLINHENAATFELLLKKVGFTVRAWITWYETFGVNCANNFNRTSRRLFYCTKHKGNFTFNHDAVTRASARQEKYGDKRAATHGKLWDDVWIIPRLVGNAKETLPDGKTQLPVELLTPIVAACSNPGEPCLELFTGSGSFIEACITLNRPALGIEKNPDRVKAARVRCHAALHAQKGGAK